MKRFKALTWIFLLVFLFTTVIAGLAWINNISIAQQWYTDISKGELYIVEAREVEYTEAAEPDTEGKKTKVYTGPVPWLNWTFVDVSTISTFIPFFGLLLITVGFFRIVKNTNNKAISEHFPFFQSYNPVTVALGLIGTLWGIIMIGYYPQDDVDMSSLILCLHTALYSTLVAVTWVFIVGYPLAYSMRWWYGKASGQEFPPDPDADTLLLFSELGAAASDASQGLRDTSSEARALKIEVSSTKTELGEVQTTLKQLREQGLKSLEHAQRIIDATLEAINSTFKSWESAGDEMKNAVQSVSKELEREGKLRTKLEEKLAEAERKRYEAESRLRSAKKALIG